MLRVVLVLFITIIPALALSQEVKLKNLRKYTQSQGLASYNIRRITQDSKGFIWAATQSGLSRFDGRTFINYTRNARPTHRLCGTDVREIIEDTTRNLIWVLSGEIGINALSTITGKVVRTVLIPFTNPDDWNICMTLINDRLWIGTSTGVKIYNLATNQFDERAGSSLTSPQFSSEVRTIAQDKQGNVWVCYSSYGIVVYQRTTGRKLAEIPLVQLNDHHRSKHIRFFSYTLRNNGNLLFATSQGLREVYLNELGNPIVNNKPCVALPSLNEESIRSVYQQKNGQFLIASSGQLYQFDSSINNSVILKDTDGLSDSNWLGTVHCLYEDQDNHLWLGCQEGLAFIPAKMSPFKVYNYDESTNRRLDHVWSIYPHNGDLLIGLRNGLVCINEKTSQFIFHDTGHEYYHIFEDYKGFIHTSRTDGMYIYEKGKFLPVASKYKELSRFAAIPINSHLFINDTLIILGTETSNGILVWNTINHTVVNIKQGSQKNGLSSGIVNNLYLDTYGRIWVLSDNIISIFSSDFEKLEEITLHEPETKRPYSLFFDVIEADGFYWLAVYGSGILQLDKHLKIKAIFNSTNGLSNDEVYQLFRPKEHQLIITSNHGLSILDLTTFKFTNYYKRDGLHSDSFEEACGLMSNDYIYAGGLNGLTIIKPQYFSKNLVPPKVYLHKVEMNTNGSISDTSNLLLQELTIPNDVMQTTVYFNGINYLNPDRITFAYRIKENNSGWIDLGVQNSIQLIGMEPGTYSFQIKATNEDGIWSNPTDFQLIFLPKWYQAWWFKILVIFVGVAVLYGFYKLRINQLTREQSIRSRLASDLHDDLGSTLNSVKVYTNLALMEKGNETYLQKIKESTQEAIRGIHDIIWVLNDHINTVDDLVIRINKFALPFCKVKAIQYNQKISEEAMSYELGAEEKRNLYMIIKEAINNSIKYADAIEITLQIFLRKGKLNVIVKDNGVGFDRAHVTSGNGLKNMKQRAEQIYYFIDIDPTAGTTIHLHKK